ncbi:helix-turn-helix domain-containing protein [Desulfosporosinus fructosivorans]|uniref:Helix-turn-helix domain-containing protein n=1 Tax=Desulfosporosinus fructosivorans TaxID=2018669 RepID=A0A4Z0R6D6_9FIRM|nr:helix-turn-helix transcriptional regulator [Desulfosporosinus fructosivorans]TGE37969.1 helix-turn-helix domain-containing protein [Desulfosporosinus fructosivorans]
MVENKALTPQEVADVLKISKSTVYDLMKRRELNAYRVGKKLRVDLEDVENYKNKTKDVKHINTLALEPSRPISSPIYEETHDKSSSFIISGQDVILDILCRYLDRQPNGVRALRSYAGSYNAVYALYQGEVQMATAHMWDGKTGEYNVPYIERMLPGTPAVVIRLASRMQGFYVAKGNPKNIKDWNDLRRSDITIINREKGSGTRILLDEHLRKLGISGRSINGYSRESQSHLAIASTVARGDADLGIGNEKACLQVQGIDFIPIQKEQYDMIIKKEDLNCPAFEAIFEIIRSDEFKFELQGLGGYGLTELGKVIAET